MDAAWLNEQLKRRYDVAVLVFLAIFAFINRDFLRGDALVPYDAHEFYLPAFTLVGDFARAGRFLLWNPFLNGGIPDFVEPQSGALSPFVIAFGLLGGGTELAFRFYFSFIWLLSGLGMLLLGRRLRAPAWGALVVAIGFSFSGFHLGHAEHVSFIHSIGLLPFTLWAIDRAIERRSPLCAAQAGALWGLSLLGGYPAIMLNNGAFCVLWAIARGVIFPPRNLDDRSDTWRCRIVATATMLAIMVGVGLVIMSPILIGMRIDAAGVTGRVAALPRKIALGENTLGPLAVTTIFSPYFARLPPATLWPGTDYSSVSLYCGGGLLVLAIFGLAARPRSGARWSLFGVALFAVLLAVGEALPVRGWLYDYLPPTRFFRHSALYRGYAIVALAVLALVGSRSLASLRRSDARFLFAAAGTAVLAYWAWDEVTSRAFDGEVAYGLWHAKVVWGGLIAIGWWLFKVEHPARQPLAALVLVGLSAWDAHGTSLIDIMHVTRNPEPLATWRRLTRLHVTDLDLTRRGFDRLHVGSADLGVGISNRNVVVKKPVLLGHVALKNSMHERWATQSILTAAATGADRIWFAADAVQAPPSEPLFLRFVQRTLELGNLPLVVHAGESMATAPSHPPGEIPGMTAMASARATQRLPHKLLRYTPSELSLEVTAPEPGWVLITERWAPGWQVRVNGQAVENRAGDFIFRAVRVDKGPSRIDMEYHPLTFPGLLILAWGTLAAVAAASALRRHPRWPEWSAWTRAHLSRLRGKLRPPRA